MSHGAQAGFNAEVYVIVYIYTYTYTYTHIGMMVQLSPVAEGSKRRLRAPTPLPR
jgi:hypothetical protein